MEENNRKGPGIFYAVVGVATLVVVIIGATFAFFSASDEDLNTIQGNIASAGGVYLSVSPLAATAEGGTKNLIPLNVNKSDTAGVDDVSQFSNAMSQKCIDNNGNQVCQVYAIKVANKSTTSTIQIRGTMTLTSKSKNLHWKLINVTNPGEDGFSWDSVSGEPTDSIIYSDETTSFTATEYSAEQVNDNVVGGVLTGAEATATHYLTIGTNSNITAEQSKGKEYARTNLGYTNGNNTAVYYVLVWLEETGKAQETEDASANFTGTVTIEAVDASGTATGITASF